MRPLGLLIASCVLLSLSLLSCDKKAPAAQGSADAPPMRSSGPTSAPPTTVVKGTVLETMDSGGYTYLRLKTEEGEKWAAVPQASIAKESEVTLSVSTEMHGFESKGLQRKFDVILFATLAPGGGGSDAATVAAAHSGSTSGKTAIETPIAKAEGDTGRTIEQVYAQKAELKDKPVAIRGKVVKYTSGVLGKNWIHLQDGSGSAEAGTFDIAVTTDAQAAVGDVVVVNGVVHLDKDFGYGYRYALIVEEAKVTK